MEYSADPAKIVRWVEARMREQRGPHLGVDAYPDRMAALHLTARERERLLRPHFRISA